jgi:uncharacterized membrane protein YhfC
MATFFDVVTVTCFVALVGAFFWFSSRQTATLLHLILAAVVFAVANQVGNAGSTLFGMVLVGAGIAYAALTLLRR